MDFETGLVVTDYDQAAFKSMQYLDYNQNMAYYIEHLAPGTGLKGMVPDYCRPDNDIEISKADKSGSDFHNLDDCTRLDAKEFEADEELCTASGKIIDVPIDANSSEKSTDGKATDEIQTAGCVSSG